MHHTIYRHARTPCPRFTIEDVEVAFEAVPFYRDGGGDFTADRRLLGCLSFITSCEKVDE
jgi:hypothetical protein